jgi:HSP20 family protein
MPLANAHCLDHPERIKENRSQVYLKKPGATMILFIKLIIMAVLTIPYAGANGGTTALDEMILHKKEGIRKAKNAREKEKLPKDLDKFFSEMVESQKREMARLEKMREKFYPEIEKSSKDMFEVENDLKNEFDQIQNQMDKIITKLKSQFHKIESASLGLPKVEIKEDPKSYDITAEIPGVEAQDVKVSVKENGVLIEGEKILKTSRKDQNMTSTEISYGDFKRSIELDHKVDPKTLKTENKNGLLLIHLEKI